MGVLVPCLLNIWGGIMFLRLGWVVGQAGIWLALVILILSYVVTTITTLSLCAIVTNGEVKGGGIYFLVGRTMGPQWGTMLGVLFFWAQAMASSMYAVGVAEVIVDLSSNYGKFYFTGEEINDVRVVSVGVIILLLGISFLGMGCFAKTQSGLFVTMIVAIIAVFVGSFFHEFPSDYENRIMGFVGYNGWRNTDPVWSYDPTRPSVHYDFFTVFAVFFPAATGIMAGANVSGDLAKPSQAIPTGTLLAVLITFISYATLIFVVGLSCVRCIDEGGGKCPPTEFMSKEWAIWAEANGSIPLGGLLYNKIIFANLVPIHPFFFFGVFASSLSSALSSLVSAPRILQAVAADGIIPGQWLKFLAVGRGPNNEPVRALIFTFFITTAVALIGNLDAIATLITNVFLGSYGLVNLACFVGASTKAGGWRPTFKKYNKWISLLGALLCVAVMFLIDASTCIVTVLLCGLVYWLVGFLDHNASWGAADDASKYVTALRALEAMQMMKKDHVKLYRAAPLVMAGAPNERPSLIKFAAMLSYTKGLVVVGDVLIQEVSRAENDADQRHLVLANALGNDAQKIRERRLTYDAYLNNKQLWGHRCPGAFAQVITGRSVLDGFNKLIHTTGIGRFRPNCALFGFPSSIATGEAWQDSKELREYEMMLRAAYASALAGVMILRDDAAVLNVNYDQSIKSPADVMKKLKQRWDRLLGKKKKKKVVFDEVTGEPVMKTTKAAAVQPADMGGIAALEADLPDDVDGDFIDVWWLADDGGFSALIPHILSMGTFFRGKKIRVFTVADSKVEKSLEHAEARMTVLFAKLRIVAKVVAVDANLDLEGEDFTAVKRPAFEKYGLGSLDDLDELERALTVRYLNLGALIQARSGRATRDSDTSRAAICFITAPVFISGLRVKLYSAWMDILTKNNGGVPMVLLRGNGEQIMTLLA